MLQRFIERNMAVCLDGEIISKRELEEERYIPCLEPIPIHGERLSYFIAGPPGCGKSTTAAQILSIFPDLPVYLFTDLEEEDRAFKGLKINKMKMDANLLDELKPSMFCQDSDCWVIFDDIDKIRDKKVSNKLIALMDNMIANGRSHGGHNIHIIATSHALNDYRKTKYMIENCGYWVIFPSKTIPSQLKRLLSKLDLDKYPIRQYDRLFIHQCTPFFICSSDFIQLI